jgi:predicted dehydrogenase
VRLAIIGCGQVVAQGHVPAIIAAREQGRVIEVAGIADLSPECLAAVGDTLAVPPARRFTVPARMLESVTADVVLLATPPARRGEMLAALAERGATVLCEKPLAPEVAEAESHARLFDKSPGRLMMCHNYAFFPEFLLMGSLVDQGVIGEPHTVMLQGMGADPWTGVRSFRPGWRLDRRWSGGGRLMDTGVHALYLAESLLGARPTAVRALLTVPPGGDVEDRCHAWYTSPRGVAVMSFGMGHGPAAAAVLGPDGHIELAYPPGTGDLAVSPVALHVAKDGKVIRTYEVPRRRGLFTVGFYDWVAQVARGEAEPGRHDAWHGAWLVRCVDGAYQAAADGTAVRLSAGTSDEARSADMEVPGK